MTNIRQQYHGLAIALHWVIAILIIVMLIMGKYMVSLDETDSLRFSLTQWHKSFGVTLLILALLRIGWRLTHKPPPLPSEMPAWEKLASGLAHFSLYLLMVLIPVSGWIMVSSSPLNIPTVIFNSFSWPHLPLLDTLPNKEFITGLFGNIHEILGLLLIGLLVAHIGAALRHHYILRDGVMARMSPLGHDGKRIPGVMSFAGVTAAIVFGLIAFGYTGGKPQTMSASNSQVGFEFVLLGNKVNGAFSESSIELALNPKNLATSSINATINTASANTGNKQIDDALPTAEWFSVSAYPTATFVSQSMTSDNDHQITVTGVLEIRGIAKEISFPMQITERDNKQLAVGEFSVNRLDYGIGSTTQPSEKSVRYGVTIRFEFDLN